MSKKPKNQGQENPNPPNPPVTDTENTGQPQAEKKQVEKKDTTSLFDHLLQRIRYVGGRVVHLIGTPNEYAFSIEGAGFTVTPNISEADVIYVAGPHTEEGLVSVKAPFYDGVKPGAHILSTGFIHAPGGCDLLGYHNGITTFLKK